MSTDYSRLRLKHHGDPAMLDRILQDECREKCASKLPSLLSNAEFRFPSLATAEMATSEAIARIHTSLVPPPPASVLDMTCGLGVDAYAFAAAGFDVTALDIDPATAREAAHNAAVLGLANMKVLEGDSLGYLLSSPRRFDIVFVDPARRDLKGRHYALADCHPDVKANLEAVMSRCDTLIIKASPMVNPGELDAVPHDTHIIGTSTECKEVVFVAGASARYNIVCHTVGKPAYVYDSATLPDISPRAGRFLLLPYPSVMKAGGNVCVAGTWKADRFSHIYFSDSRPDTLPTPFPGTAREVVEAIDFNKAAIKSFASRYPWINVSARNFPLTAPELAKRLKIKEGGDLFLYATTLSDSRKVLVITRSL